MAETRLIIDKFGSATITISPVAADSPFGQRGAVVDMEVDTGLEPLSVVLDDQFRLALVSALLVQGGPSGALIVLPDKVKRLNELIAINAKDQYDDRSGSFSFGEALDEVAKILGITSPQKLLDDMYNDAQE